MKKLAVITRISGGGLQYYSSKYGWQNNPQEAQFYLLDEALEQIGRTARQCGVICWVEGTEPPFAVAEEPEEEDYRCFACSGIFVGRPAVCKPHPTIEGAAYRLCPACASSVVY